MFSHFHVVILFLSFSEYGFVFMEKLLNLISQYETTQINYKRRILYKIKCIQTGYCHFALLQKRKK